MKFPAIKGLFQINLRKKKDSSYVLATEKSKICTYLKELSDSSR